MRYSLTRKRDGAGASVPMSTAMFAHEGGTRYEHRARPRVGVAMRVGALTAPTFGSGGWWQTTLITKIISDTPTKVVFKTTNSTYTWKTF